MKKMKISNLFHWLYGALMLAPIFAVASGILVNVFNKDLTNDVQVNYKYETNEVNSNDDIIVGNIYHISLSDDEMAVLIADGGSNFELDFDIIGGSYTFSSDFDDMGIDELYHDDVLADFLPNLYLEYFGDDNYLQYYFYNYNYDSGYYTFYTTYYIGSNTLPLMELDIVVRSVYTESYTLYNCLSKCENIPIDSVDITENDTSDIFYKSLDTMKDSVYFNWANESFLSSPFRYITDLFGMPSENVTTQLLSYWCSISIIWLVFDIVMFVPLLVHSWIDKGGIE